MVSLQAAKKTGKEEESPSASSIAYAPGTGFDTEVEQKRHVEIIIKKRHATRMPS